MLEYTNQRILELDCRASKIKISLLSLKTELELILQAELLRREAIAPLGIAEVHEPKLEKPCSVCSYDCYISGAVLI